MERTIALLKQRAKEAERKAAMATDRANRMAAFLGIEDELNAMEMSDVSDDDEVIFVSETRVC